MLLNVKYPKNASCKIPTEDTFINNLSKSKLIPEDYILVNCNWTKYINAYGVNKTQQRLNEVKSFIIEKKLNLNKAIFICQHILVDKLNWPSRLVFTPHASIKNKHIPIPHFAFNHQYSEDKRKIFASFMGSFDTHICRKKLKQHENKDVIILDSGEWFHYRPDIEREQKYKYLLSNSKFTFCPRGTGPSTIRIWESLASGSIPVIISDELVLPKIDLAWTEIAIFIKENNIENCMSILSQYDESKINNMSKLGKYYYDNYFSPINMHNIIIGIINDQSKL